MLPTLTQRQLAVLDFIHNSIKEQGYPPTLREIGNHLGIRSTNGVNDHLRALEKKGYIERQDMKSRTLRVLQFPESEEEQEEQTTVQSLDAIIPATLEIPIVGRVAAGALTEAIESSQDSVCIDRMLIGGAPRDVFGLRIQGESMIEAGIQDGDYVFVRKQITANRGDIVIALVGEDATCKYYFPELDHIRLEPANKQMAPILIPQNEWQSTKILGVVVGIYRKLQ